MSIGRFLGQAYGPDGEHEPWAGTLLGFSSTSVIGADGCFLTALTMAANALKGTDWNPDDANDIVKSGAGFNGSLLKLEEAARSLDCRAPEAERIHDYQHAGVDELRARLDQVLGAGGLAFVHVDKSHTGTGRHFLLVHGRDGDSYQAADPALARDVFIPSATLAQDVMWGATPVHYDVVGVAPIYRS